MDDDELYQHAMGPMTQLINEQNNYMQFHQQQQQHQLPPPAQQLQYPQYTQQSFYFPQQQAPLPVQSQSQSMQSTQFPQHEQFHHPQQQQPFLSMQQMDDYYQDPQLHQYPHSSNSPEPSYQLSKGLQQHLDQQEQQLQSYSSHFEPPQEVSGLNQLNQYNEYELSNRAYSGSDQDNFGRTSQSSTVSQFSHPIQIVSSLAPSIESVQQQQQQQQQQQSSLPPGQQLPTTVESTSTPFGVSSLSSYSSKNSQYNADVDRSRNLDIYSKDLLSPAASVQSSINNNEIPFIRHEFNEPQFDLMKSPEFFHETIPNAFARIFLLKEVHSRLKRAMISPTIYSGMILQGLGTLTVVVPELESLFLKYRGVCMSTVREELSNISDANAEHLLVLTSLLNSSSIFIKNMTVKDFFSLASGPSVLLRTAFEDPTKFKKSFMKLKNHADGLLFTARSVWNPRYNHRALFELLDVVKEFGIKYIDDEDQYNDDDLIKVQYGHLVEFIEFALNFLEGERSNKHVLCYPVDKIYKLVQLWYQWVPSEIYTFSSKTPSVEKVFYVFWFALADMLEDILVGGRYIFTFLFNGFYLLYPFNKNHLYENMEDENLIKYANYSCRVLAFLSRRKAYIVRNTVLNDPIPAFFDSVDRFKPRSLDIHERCVTEFKRTKIRPYHYPSEATTSGNLINGVNYYKTNDDGDEQDKDTTADLLTGLNTDLDGEASEEATKEVDLLDVNPDTALLNDDYDPRFTDPIFQTNVVFQNADLNFLNHYHEDRKLIIQLDTE